jgi:hypothetical protein
MGFSSSLKKFGRWVKKAAQDTSKWVKGAATKVYGTAKNVVNRVYDDMSKTRDKIVGSATGFVDNVGKFIPYIMVGAVAIAGVYYMSTRNGGVKRQFSRGYEGGGKRIKYGYSMDEGYG